MGDRSHENEPITGFTGSQTLVWEFQLGSSSFPAMRRKLELPQRSDQAPAWSPETRDRLKKTAFSSRSSTNQKKYWQGCYELENWWVSSIQELEIKHPEPKGETS
jgi:hypothetical protein